MQASFLFDNLSPTYNAVNSWVSLGLHNVARKKAVAQISDKLKSPSILDLYCGAGNNIPALLSAFPLAKIDAIDHSESMIALGTKSYQSEKIQFLQADFLAHNFQGKKYDAIICSFGLKCIPPDLYEKYFSTLANLLLPKGEIIFLDIANSNKKWQHQLFKYYLKIILWLHPKVDAYLRPQYLQLIDFMQQFDTKVFLRSVKNINYLTIVKCKMRLPMIHLYKITKS